MQLDQSKISQGRLGEILVEKFCRQNGFSVLARNQRFSLNGEKRKIEVDLIIQRDRLILICEIKTHHSGGMPLLSQRQKMRLTKLLLAAKSRYQSHFDIKLALIWLDPLSETIEFLLNP